jgi:hypothetical protein
MFYKHKTNKDGLYLRGRAAREIEIEWYVKRSSPNYKGEALASPFI